MLLSRDSTIVVRLQGGLGNQLFQVAAALAWVGEQPENILVHLANYHAEDNRPYLLDIFTGPIKQLERSALKWILGNERQIKNGLPESPSLTWCAKVAGWKVVSEGDGQKWGQGGRVYLDGFWQDVRLVESVAGLCQTWFAFKPCCSEAPALVDLRRENSVAVHVRRGDFQNHPGTTLVGPSYYRKAVDCLQIEVPQARFFVFSDEPLTAQSLIDWPPKTVFLPFRSGKQAAEDFYLMSQASNHIISNSTFSWWAAWLASGNILIHPEIRGSRIYTSGAFRKSREIGVPIQ